MTMMEMILESGVFRRYNGNDSRVWAPFGPDGDSRTTLVAESDGVMVGPGVRVKTYTLLDFDQRGDLIGCRSISYPGADD